MENIHGKESGVHSPHGAKLPCKISIEDKKSILNQVETWRQARKEKLAARLFAKNQSAMLNVSSSILGVKSSLHGSTSRMNEAIMLAPVTQNPKKKSPVTQKLKKESPETLELTSESSVKQPTKHESPSDKQVLKSTEKQDGSGGRKRLTVFDRLYQSGRKSTVEKPQEIKKPVESSVRPETKIVKKSIPQNLKKVFPANLGLSKIPKKSKSSSNIRTACWEVTDCASEPTPDSDKQLAEMGDLELIQFTFHGQPEGAVQPSPEQPESNCPEINDSHDMTETIISKSVLDTDSTVNLETEPSRETMNKIENVSTKQETDLQESVVDTSSSADMFDVSTTGVAQDLLTCSEPTTGTVDTQVSTELNTEMLDTEVNMKMISTELSENTMNFKPEPNSEIDTDETNTDTLMKEIGSDNMNTVTMEMATGSEIINTDTMEIEIEPEIVNTDSLDLHAMATDTGPESDISNVINTEALALDVFNTSDTKVITSVTEPVKVELKVIDPHATHNSVDVSTSVPSESTASDKTKKLSAKPVKIEAESTTNLPKKGIKLSVNQRQNTLNKRTSIVRSRNQPPSAQVNSVEVSQSKTKPKSKASVTFRDVAAKPLVEKKQQKTSKPLRRSISMVHNTKSGSKDSAIHRAPPPPVLQEIPIEQLYGDQPRRLSTVKESLEELQAEEAEAKIVRRRSKSVSFMTPKTKIPSTSSLKEELEQWLQERGQSMSEFKHLGCFGLNLAKFPTTPFRERGRTPRRLDETMSPNASLYATAPSTPCEDSDKENSTPATAIQQFSVEECKAWLEELHQLIVKHQYPYERCDAWLTAIRRQCSQCAQLPIYWECLAALEESRGDMNSAIEFYERAIIKGAEVDSVVGSLTKLFDKFVQVDPDKQTKSKVKQEVDPKNIFTSTIIKFALQQKAVKSLSSEMGIEAKKLHYVVTPVRRSTRISTTPAKAKVINSLQQLSDLSPKTRTNVQFQPNASLLTGE